MASGCVTGDNARADTLCTTSMSAPRNKHVQPSHPEVIPQKQKRVQGAWPPCLDVIACAHRGTNDTQCWPLGHESSVKTNTVLEESVQRAGTTPPTPIVWWRQHPEPTWTCVENSGNKARRRRMTPITPLDRARRGATNLSETALGKPAPCARTLPTRRQHARHHASEIAAICATHINADRQAPKAHPNQVTDESATMPRYLAFSPGAPSRWAIGALAVRKVATTSAFAITNPRKGGERAREGHPPTAAELLHKPPQKNGRGQEGFQQACPCARLLPERVCLSDRRLSQGRPATRALSKSFLRALGGRHLGLAKHPPHNDDGVGQIRDLTASTPTANRYPNRSGRRGRNPTHRGVSGGSI